MVSANSLAIPPELPTLGDASEQTLPRYVEKKWGAHILKSLLKGAPLVEDPLLHQTLSQITANLQPHLQSIEALRQQPIDFQLFLINAPDVNAFALPGGYIGFFSGLILLADYEDEVAGEL